MASIPSSTSVSCVKLSLDLSWEDSEEQMRTTPFESPKKREEESALVVTPTKKSRVTTEVTPQMKRMGMNAKDFFSESPREDKTARIVQEIHRACEEGITREEASLLLESASCLSFACRKENIRELALYEKDALFSLCELVHGMGTLSEREGRNFTSTINIILGHQTQRQQTILYDFLRQDSIKENPIYEPLRKRCFERSYSYVDGDRSDSPSSKEVLLHVIQRAEEKKAQKVHEFASRLLGRLNGGEAISTDYLFHMTPALENVSKIQKNGIEVTDRSKYKGAFVSTQPEEAFGDYGVAVSPYRAAVKGSPSHIERRSRQNGNSVWIGFKKRLTPSRHVVVVSDKVTPRKRSRLQTELAKNESYAEIVDADTLRQFCAYARELGHVIPVSKRAYPPGKIAPWDEPSEK